MDNIQNPLAKKIIVIGGGIGGLYAAWKLLQEGFEITIIERQKFLGGLSTSIKKNDCHIDIGPHYVSIDKTSKIYNDINNLLNKDEIIELSEVNKSYKSFFQNEILDTPPRLSNIVKNNKNSLVKSLFKDILPKTKSLSDNVSSDEYLISLYGEEIFNSWCKPILIQNYGEIPPVQFVKNSFEPITIKKTLNYLSKNQKILKNDIPYSNDLDCYFKNGMGSIIDSLENQIITLGGKIILDANVESVQHEGSKLVKYSKNNESSNESGDIILYSIPLNHAIRWFKESPQNLNKNDNSAFSTNGILVFLLVDNQKLFDGWILDVYDLSIPFFRITQQTFLSSAVAPKNKALLCFEMRSKEDDHFWSSDDETIFNLAKNALKKIFELEDNKIEKILVIKLKNLYRPKHHSFQSTDQEISTYIQSFPNEYALGTTAFDTGDNPTRLSHDEIVKVDKKKSYGGFFNSLLNSQKIIETILSNEKSEKHKS